MKENTFRFEEIGINEDNDLNIVALLRAGSWKGLVDDKSGGIVLVGRPDWITFLVKMLNQLDSMPKD